MSKLENWTERLVWGSHTLYGVLSKYIQTLKDALDSGFEISDSDRKQLMIFISEAYEQMGDLAESVSWKARAMGEAYAEKSKENTPL